EWAARTAVRVAQSPFAHRVNQSDVSQAARARWSAAMTEATRLNQMSQVCRSASAPFCRPNTHFVFPRDTAGSIDCRWRAHAMSATNAAADLAAQTNCDNR